MAVQQRQRRTSSPRFDLIAAPTHPSVRRVADGGSKNECRPPLELPKISHRERREWDIAPLHRQSGAAFGSEQAMGSRAKTSRLSSPPAKAQVETVGKGG